MVHLDRPVAFSVRAPRASDLIDLARAVAADEERSEAELLERDAAIGRGLATAGGAPNATQRLLRWLERVREGRGSADWLALLSFVVLALGAIFGVLAAIAAFAFDGPAGRVNVVLVLALFVGLQWLGLLAALLSMTPWVEGIPMFGALRGRGWEQLALRLAPRDQRSRLESLFGRGEESRGLYGELRSALILRWSQLAATAFAVAALLWMIGLVVFTDLAFGWSTTLDVSSSQAHVLARAVAAPWRAFWPAALPSAELVEATRFFRVAPNAGATSPQLLGRWWPFVVATVACYALIPRLVALVLSGRRLRRVVADTFEAVPGAQRVLARIDSAAVATRARQAESGDASPEQGEHSSLGLMPERASVIDWAEALSASPASSSAAGALLGIEVDAIAAAGGHLELAADRKAIALMAQQQEAVLVAVRGYETPVLELRDFLSELRRGIGRERDLALALIGRIDEQRLAAWFRWLAPLRDVELRLTAVDPADSVLTSERTK